MSLNEKHDDSLVDVLKMIFKLQDGESFLKVRINSFLTLNEVVPRKGKIIRSSSLGSASTGSLLSNILLKKYQRTSFHNHFLSISSLNFQFPDVAIHKMKIFCTHDTIKMKLSPSYILLVKRT